MSTGLRQVADELRAWIDEVWDPALSLVEWRGRLADAGWACPNWPPAWCGRGLPAEYAQLVDDELARAGVPGPADGVGRHLAGPTLLEHGSEELKRRLLRPTVTGEITWCQLFSEPGAGSDLAGLTARADRDGDEWTVSGQKVWSTGASHADLGLLLARTDWEAPKHQGITYFVLPMRQPGVEVRPLRQMNGHASFNEIFLDGARVSAADVVGQVGRGLAGRAHDAGPRAPARTRQAAAARPRPIEESGLAGGHGGGSRGSGAVQVVPAARGAGGPAPRSRPRSRQDR